MNEETAIEAISADESSDLVQLETVIANGLQTFVEVGGALAEIRDRKLYRIEHSTFDDYLEKKWRISRSKASRLISAAETAKLLPIGNTPKSESVVRPLTKLPPEKRAETWREAVGASPNGKPSAREVQSVVARKESNPANKGAGEAPNANSVPLEGMTWLQTATYAYGQLNADDRRLFRNFQAGLEA